MWLGSRGGAAPLRALSETARYLTALTFAVLAVLTFVRWRRRAAETNRWAALTFGTLMVATLPSLVADIAQVRTTTWVQKGVLGALVLFPYFLYRLTTSFMPRQPLARLAVGVTGVALIATLLAPEFPNEGRLPAWYAAYLTLFSAQWTLLSFIAALLLWRAGRHQPTLARRRMRTLSVAAAGMIVALLFAVGASTATSPAIDLAVRLLGLASGIGFFLALAPPSLLRVMWRYREQQSLQEAIVGGLMGATTVRGVTDTLLPHAAEIVGGTRAELIDEEGNVVASHSPPHSYGGSAGEGQEGQIRYEDIALRPPYGYVRVWTTPHTPFFGDDELRLLHSLGAVTDLALQRTFLLENERRARSQLEVVNEQLTSTNQDLEREVAHRKNAEEDLRSQAEELLSAREEAEAANRAKSEFLSRMSHELRTPLNAILGFGQLLEMENLEEDQRESVGHILRAGRHLLGLINEVLDIARIEAGRLPISVEAVSIGNAVAEAVAMVRPIAADRHIDIDVDVTRDRNFHVLADRQRLKQVLLNLLSNAVKYNREKGKVWVSVDEVRGGRLGIAVADTGPGIPEHKLGALFTPFDRLGAEGSDVEGSGLGLALSKSVVEAMGGELSVRSTLGEGSVFSVELPLSQSPMRSALDRHGEAGTRVGRVPGRVKILYIEDNLSNLRLIEQVLRLHSSAQLFTAMQGQMGLDLARRHDPDIILLDLHLPDMDGGEVLRRLRDDERTRHIPVVMITADATAGSIRRLLDKGANDYLSKPLNIRRFLDVLSHNLSERVS
jgi:signal transduction histidine kinase